MIVGRAPKALKYFILKAVALVEFDGQLNGVTERCMKISSYSLQNKLFWIFLFSRTDAEKEDIRWSFMLPKRNDL